MKTIRNLLLRLLGLELRELAVCDDGGVSTVRVLAERPAAKPTA